VRPHCAPLPARRLAARPSASSQAAPAQASLRAPTPCCRHCCRRDAQAAQAAQAAAQQQLSAQLAAARAAREADARAVAARLQHALGGCDLAVLEAERLVAAKDLLLARWKDEAGHVGRGQGLPLRARRPTAG
jgi:hypothetical protein